MHFQMYLLPVLSMFLFLLSETWAGPTWSRALMASQDLHSQHGPVAVSTIFAMDLKAHVVLCWLFDHILKYAGMLTQSDHLINCT